MKRKIKITNGRNINILKLPAIGDHQNVYTRILVMENCIHFSWVADRISIFELVDLKQNPEDLIVFNLCMKTTRLVQR